MTFRAWILPLGRLSLILCTLPLLAAPERSGAAEPIKIELPLFEGGAGKAFYLECARDYELTGTWDVALEEAKELKLRDGKFTWGSWKGTYESVGPEEGGQRWKLSGDGVTGTIFATALRLRGEVKISAGAGGAQRTQTITGTKRDPIIVDMYLDPRIADKVQVRVLEGSFFEMTNAFINYWPLIHNGDVVPLNSYLEGPNWEGDAKWKDTFLPGALDTYMDKGEHYGIPQGYFPFVIWTNKKMFREHGWMAPRTWDELFALCEKVKQAGIAPLAFQGRYPYYAQALYDHAYYHLLGEKMYFDRQNLVPGTFDNPQDAECIRLLRKLGQEDFQAGAMGMSHTESQLQFFLGKTAMIPCGSWLKSEMMGKIPDDFELGCFNLPIPKQGKADPSIVNVHTEPYFAMKHSKHPELGVDFLRLMTSRRMAGRFAKLQDIPVAIKGANEGNLSHDLDDLMQIVAAAKGSYGAVPGEGYPEMQQVNGDMMYMILAGKTPPAQLARQFEQMVASVRMRQDNPDKVLVNHRWKPAILLALLALGAAWAVWNTARKFRRTARVLDAARAEGLQPMRWHNVLLFIGPAVAIYTIFIIVPCIRSFSWSLHDWNGLTGMDSMPYKGLLNFRRLLLESDAFWIALKNNLFLMFVVPLFVVPLSMFLAASISRGIWGSKMFRIVFFFPNLLGGVAATLLWLHVYNPQGGLINGALVAVGINSFDGFAWLEPKNLYWALIPISIWGACGFNMVLYLAAMESIPETYYEAARIDGASPWRQFWTITLPLIWEVLAISLVFLVIGGMKAFETIWLLTNQQPNTESHVVGTLLVQTMFKEYKVGQATALAVLLFLMIFIGTAATLRGMKRETVEM